MRIFIELPTWLGDAIMATPAIDNIVLQYPKCRLIIFGSFASTAIFTDHQNLDRIIIDKSRESGLRYLNLYRYAQDIGCVDMAFSFRKTITTRILLFLIKSPKTFIYQRYDQTYGLHQVIRYNDFVNQSLSISSTPKDLQIYVNFEKNKSKKKKLLGINPGATYGSAKRWYPKEFAKVANELGQKYDIIIFGGPGEEEIAKDIEINLTIKNYQNLCGKLSIKELCEHIGGLELFITNDSGPMHIAAAFKVKIIALFGPTKYKQTYQWGNPKYKLMPVLEFIEEFIVPLEKELDWGYSIPYMVTGQLTEHPRSAMKARANGDTNYVDFYKNLAEDFS